MVTATYSPDPFNAGTGTLTATFNIFQSDTQKIILQKENIRAWVERHIRQTVVEMAEKMYKQRQENYSYVQSFPIKPHQIEALEKLPFYIMSARVSTDLYGFALAISKSVLPLLVDLQPGESSRFFEHYTDKLRQMQICVKKLLQKDQIFCLEFTQKTLEFT
ncbi:MAG: hypothetical protein NTX61_08330 [Bacteroidetes bacterium]|nr:hypothetical protein [Bacteroidota bacterium]